MVNFPSSTLHPSLPPKTNSFLFSSCAFYISWFFFQSFCSVHLQERREILWKISIQFPSQAFNCEELKYSRKKSFLKCEFSATDSQRSCSWCHLVFRSLFTFPFWHFYHYLYFVVALPSSVMYCATMLCLYHVGEIFVGGVRRQHGENVYSILCWKLKKFVFFFLSLLLLGYLLWKFYSLTVTYRSKKESKL